jgi:DinB superfamily
VERTAASDRAHGLAARLEVAADALFSTVDRIDRGLWSVVAQPGTWSIGKEVEHVAEAAAYHQWIVRLTIGESVPSRRPALERRQMTSLLAPGEAVELLRQRTEDGARLLRELSDEQLDLPTRPPRARAQVLAVTIERVLIGHYDAHRADIEAKRRALG